MDAQAILQREASRRGLTLATLCQVSTISSSQKVVCCGGFLERVVAESAQDCTVLLRDATGTVHCVIHGAVSSRYPDVLAAGALLLFRDVTLLVTSTLMPPLLIVCLEHLAALMLPEGPPGIGRNQEVGGASAALPPAEMLTQGNEDISGRSRTQHHKGVDKRVNGTFSEVTDPTTTGPMPTNSIGSVEVCDDEDCLQFADDL